MPFLLNKKTLKLSITFKTNYFYFYTIVATYNFDVLIKKDWPKGTLLLQKLYLTLELMLIDLFVLL